MDKTPVAERYRELRPTYEILCLKLKTLLEELLKNAGIQFHVVEARAKTVESFNEKSQREGKGYQDPLAEITDLAALRIIVYYQGDVDAVVKMVDTEFRVDPSKSVDKRRELAPDQFGYISVHKVVKLSHKRGKLSEWKSCRSLIAEIQVRTVLQHAWAAIDHALKYKGLVKGTSEFTRRLVRLSGLLELADEEFETLKQEREVIKKRTSEQVEKGNLKIPVDVISFLKYSEQSPTLKKIGNIAKAAGIVTDFDFGDDMPVGMDLVGACDLLG